MLTCSVMERCASKEERYHVLVMPDATIVTQQMETRGFARADR